MNVLTPKQTVEQLDKYIIGQDEAKRTVAIALRNRYRRSRLPEEMREEIIPKNIIMVGPTPRRVLPAHRPDGRRKNRNCPQACEACGCPVCEG